MMLLRVQSLVEGYMKKVKWVNKEHTGETLFLCINWTPWSVGKRSRVIRALKTHPTYLSKLVTNFPYV